MKPVTRVMAVKHISLLTCPLYHIGLAVISLALCFAWYELNSVILIVAPCISYINQQMHYIKFHIKTLKFALTCFDPKIILRERRCSLLKSF